jgi:hypothetical protein
LYTVDRIEEVSCCDLLSFLDCKINFLYKM